MQIEKANGYVPGALGDVVKLHGLYYGKHWQFGIAFEEQVAKQLAAFLQRYDPVRDGFWLATVDNNVLGSVSIDGLDGHSTAASLRWLIVAQQARGSGLGNGLLNAAVIHCRNQNYSRIVLNTFAGLNAAIHLYEKAGFRLTEENPSYRWGPEIVEQKFVLDLN